MESYTVEYQVWDDVLEVKFLVDNLVELFQEVGRWQRKNAITDSAIISIELD